MENKIIKVDFSDGKPEKPVLEGLSQWDIGTKLEIHGLELEEDTQVHFSLDEYCGEAPRMIGTYSDGILTVGIPCFISEGENESCYYNDKEYKAYAWLYIVKDNYEETRKKITLYYQKRPKPAGYISPGDTQLILNVRGELNSKVSKYGHAPNKFLGTDEEGNVVEKDAPAGGGSEYGIPAGGTKGQYLRKVSDKDYDVAWSDLEIPEQYGLVTYNQDKTLTIT